MLQVFESSIAIKWCTQSKIGVEGKRNFIVLSDVIVSIYIFLMMLAINI